MYTRIFMAAEGASPASERLKSQPRGIGSLASLEKVVVACHKHIVVFVGRKQTLCVDTKFEGSCAAMHSNGKIVAVGGQVWWTISISILGDATTQYYRTAKSIYMSYLEMVLSWRRRRPLLTKGLSAL